MIVRPLPNGVLRRNGLARYFLAMPATGLDMLTQASPVSTW